MVSIPRSQYADLFGPTTGDKFQLADTNLIAEIEKDFTVYGDENIYGGGKTARDGMGLKPGATHASGALDLVITNVIIMDPIQGIVKADIGIRDGKIAGIGKSGNPDIMEGVHPDLVTSANTEVISGEGQIATAGGIDSHIHMISPQQAYQRAFERHHDAYRRWHRPDRRHQRHHLHARVRGIFSGCWRRTRRSRSMSACLARATARYPKPRSSRSKRVPAVSRTMRTTAPRRLSSTAR